MSNPTLNNEQLRKAHELLERIRVEIAAISENKEELIYAFKKKIRKELMYDERSKPGVRRRLKDLMWKKQKGLCAICHKELPVKYTELDRFEAIKGYVEGNVQLVHHECHIQSQAEKGYK